MTETKIILRVKRKNGDIEIIDISKHHSAMNQMMFDKIRKDTLKAGRGTVEEIKYYHPICNMRDLIKNYNDFNNEGGEGYIPENSYFMALPEYQESEVTEVFK